VARKTLVIVACVITLMTMWPAGAAAQRRVARPRSSRPVVVVARPYYPVFYSPFHFGVGWYSGWYPGWYGYNRWAPYGPYGYYDQYYPPRYYYDRTSSARLQVKPKQAEVFVDGYFVGTVDDFDGWLQRLHLPAGEHELQLYLDGHRTMTQRLLFRPGVTLKITHTMQPLAPGEAQDPRPVPAEPSRAQRPGYGRYPAHPPDAPRARAAETGEFGSIAIRVQPGDAEVLVDGEPWDAPEGAHRLVIELPEGQHRVEVRKDGFRTYTANVRIRRGETYALNVSLTRE
jgi:hypothetical protein